MDLDPDDYTGVTTVITFAPGQTVQTVDVSTEDDDDSESTESFTATLSNASPSNVVFITQPTATVNIADNDGKHLEFAAIQVVCIISWWHGYGHIDGV